MQTHVWKRNRLKPWNANPDAWHTIVAGKTGLPGLRAISRRIERGLHAIKADNEAKAEVPERWHALVRFGEREKPIKFAAMTRAEGRERNRTIRDLGMEWVQRDPVR